MEDDGALVINSGYGIENCTRERMTRILVGSGIPFPESITVGHRRGRTGAPRRTHMNKCWIKRGDYHTMHKEDVSYVRHPEEAQEVLQEYFLRGIKRAVINAPPRRRPDKILRHRGLYLLLLVLSPLSTTIQKYGYERVNGIRAGTEFDIEQLRAICGKAAETLDVKIYGGDCVVASDGTISASSTSTTGHRFAPCRRADAAHHAYNERRQGAIRQQWESKRPQR